ncbi:MAG TPA: hypothetical protein VJB57_11325 [Dehalococcoidia bacterium]|nr:hypothetical protein [Dehalococcoidia bacterium]
MKHYDLLREVSFVFLAVGALVVLLAVLLGSPDYPTVRAQDVAMRQPFAFLRASANILAGNHSIQDYGPPYTPGTAKAQHILGVAPAGWAGATDRIDPETDFILKPLSRVAILNADMADALSSYEAASASQRRAWTTNYLSSLDNAAGIDGAVEIPPGEYGPVGKMMDGMLNLGKSGLLEGALETNLNLPFTLDFTRSLLYFQDEVYAGVANKLDMTGSDWGITHETGRYPGAWWLLPYAFLYQVPPFSSSRNADLLIGCIMSVAFVGLLLVPVIPLVNQGPRWLRAYRLIWRDWYEISSARKELRQ